jgi:hypothetical protein
MLAYLFSVHETLITSGLIEYSVDVFLGDKCNQAFRVYLKKITCDPSLSFISSFFLEEFNILVS